MNRINSIGRWISIILISLLLINLLLGLHAVLAELFYAFQEKSGFFRSGSILASFLELALIVVLSYALLQYIRNRDIGWHTYFLVFSLFLIGFYGFFASVILGPLLEIMELLSSNATKENGKHFMQNLNVVFEGESQCIAYIEQISSSEIEKGRVHGIFKKVMAILLLGTAVFLIFLNVFFGRMYIYFKKREDSIWQDRSGQWLMGLALFSNLGILIWLLFYQPFRLFLQFSLHLDCTDLYRGGIKLSTHFPNIWHGITNLNYTTTDWANTATRVFFLICISWLLASSLLKNNINAHNSKQSLGL